MTSRAIIAVRCRGIHDQERRHADRTALPDAGPAPDTQSPELLRQVVLALALRDETIGGAEAAELADRAVALALERSLDAPAALEAAKER